MKNKLLMSSMSTIIGLYGLFVLFLIFIFEVAGISVEYLLVTSIIFLLVQYLLAPIFTDWIMRLLYKADFNVEIPEYLTTFINQVCSEHHMKFPKIGYINDGAPNAFTYGRTKNDARVVLTRGIFDLLTPEEVKAVVAHELGHAVHYDMLCMTIAQLVPLILRWIYEVTIRAADDKDGGMVAVIGLIAYILHIITQYVLLWFSRTREYYADQFAVEKTHNPSSMSSALIKVGYGLVSKEETDDNKKKKVNIASVSALGIFDAKTAKALAVSSYNNGVLETNNIKKAARWELWNPWATWYEIHSTHPRISKRLKAISNMAPIYNQAPYVVFDEQKPESYVDDFLIEVLIQFLPVFIIIMAITAFICLESESYSTLIIGLTMTGLAISSFIQLKRGYKNNNYIETNVSDLLAEVKVSKITSVPCTLKGTFIGKGTPGYIFSEDFVLKDETGIVFIDYHQPLSIMNFFFGLFKAKKYIDKEVIIKGWYRRAPVPYVELYSMTVDNETKYCYTYAFKKAMIIILLLAGAIISFL